MTGKCPKCEKLISNALVDGIEVGGIGQPTWRGITLLCPFCHTILSVAIDPIAIKTDIINGVVAKLKGH